MLVLGGAHVASLALQGVGIVPLGPDVKAADTSKFVAQDTFDDNTKDAAWRILTDDAANCVMKEVNKRLELQATSETSNASAGYVSGGWRLDPRYDFTLKVDFHYDLKSWPGGWISFGVTPEVADPWEKNAAIGVGCADQYAHYWVRQQDGLAVRSSAAQRSRTDGTFYISYNSSTDELCLGMASYNADDAWWVLPGLVKGEWGGRPVFIWLAGGSDALAVSSGHAYLDNLVVESGMIMESSLKDVYRFWSPVLERHFYTMGDAERQTLIAQYKNVWTCEGPVYRAFESQTDPNTLPVYRFWSDKISAHFYTVSESEKDWLISQYAHVWTFECVAFYAYPVGRQPAGAIPVYRLWSPTKNDHFYTISETERKNLSTNFPGVWQDEGIAWYAVQ